MPASSCSSTASGNFIPACENNFTPLSGNGLCEAEMTTPASKSFCRTRQATPGVVITPAKATRRSRGLFCGSRGEQGGHVRTRFASVQADEDMSRAMFSPEIRAERASRGVERGVVQRRRARYAANPVGSKKLFAHFEEPCLPTVRSIVQPTSLPTTSAKLNIGKTMTYGPLQPMPHLLLRTILRIGATSLPDLLDRHAGLGHRKQFRRMC